jgi:hypothetical protein
MFPLIAIGAAILGAVGAVAAAETSSPKSAPKSKPAEQTQNSILPQSYVVTPLSGDQMRTITPMEGVTRFIV